MPLVSTQPDGQLIDIPLSAALARQRGTGKTYNLFDYGAINDGATDVQRVLRSLFQTLASVSGAKTVIIPPGQYRMAAGAPVVVPNDLTVVATGAEFTFPTSLNGSGTASIFTGVDVQNFTWIGGKFTGYVFDPFKAGGYATNAWTPTQGVRTFFFTSSVTGCSNLRWSNVDALNTGLAVVCVKGKSDTNWPTVAEDVSASMTPVTLLWSDNITLENCRFINCGQRLWDYGWLWQILTRESQYSADLIAMANQYIIASSNIGTFTWANGSQDILFNNSPTKIPLGTVDSASQYITVGGPDGILPGNVNRGSKLYCVYSDATKIRLSTTHLGGAITASSSSGAGARLFYNITACYSDMLMPTGAADIERGAFCFVDCSNVKIIDTTWSAPGDSMLMLRCNGVVISGCLMKGSIMGGLFFCRVTNASVSGNTIDGTNCSHAVSIEYSSNVSLSGNSFPGGGRGALFIVSDHISIVGNSWYKNNTKNYNNYTEGRLYVGTGFPSWNASPFFQIDGAWSDFTFTGNVVVTSIVNPAPTFQFNGSGSRMLLKDNVFSGDKLFVKKLTGFTLTEVEIGNNKGGCYGYVEGQYTASVSNVASVVIPHGIPASTLQNDDLPVIWKGRAQGANSTTVGITYVTADATNVTVFFSPNITGTVLINWSVQGVLV